VSQMVGAFPELQGVMGGEYARVGGMGAAVAAAIRDHYLPRSADDIASGNYPGSPAGDVLSIADKLDSVVACWSAGLMPTGAGDPFALRRQSQGVVSLVLAKGYRLRLPAVVKLAAAQVCPKLGADEAAVNRGVQEFILARFRGLMIENGLPYDVVDACLAAWNGDLHDTQHKIEAVARMKARPDFDQLMIAFRRVMNIVEGDPGPVDTHLFQHESEAVLYSEYTRIQHRVTPLLSVGKYDDALAEMAGLKPQVDRLFDDVMVNVEDLELRRNRQALCATVAALFKEVADFSRIVIAGDREAKNQGRG